MPSDITICIVYCGADVQGVPKELGWYVFPCLAPVVNLCAKKFVLKMKDSHFEIMDVDVEKYVDTS